MSIFLERSATDVKLDDIRFFECDPEDWRDDQDCLDYCLLEGFRAGYCVHFDDEDKYRCKCYD